MGKQSKSRGAALDDSPLQARMSATTSITDLFSSGAFDYRAIRAIGGAGSGANASRERQPRISSFGDSQGNVARKRASISRACSRGFLPIDPQCKDGPRAANRKLSATPARHFVRRIIFWVPSRACGPPPSRCNPGGTSRLHGQTNLRSFPGHSGTYGRFAPGVKKPRNIAERSAIFRAKGKMQRLADS